MSDDVVIRVRGLKTQFGRQVIHEGLDLDVRRGEIMGVVGGSGTGKSVLLKEIVGLIRPRGGSIELLGQTTERLSRRRRKALNSRLGVLFQDGALFSSLTVSENIQIPLKEHTKLPRDFMSELANVKLTLVGLDADAGAKFPSNLSGGMRKRAGLARALALDPEILFLDEPTAGLDPIAAGAFDKLIRDLRNSLGNTVFMVTHDLDSLAAICDRIAVLVDRKVVVDTLANLRAYDHPWIQAYFGGPRGRAALGSPGLA